MYTHIRLRKVGPSMHSWSVTQECSWVSSSDSTLAIWQPASVKKKLVVEKIVLRRGCNWLSFLKGSVATSWQSSPIDWRQKSCVSHLIFFLAELFKYLKKKNVTQRTHPIVFSMASVAAVLAEWLNHLPVTEDYHLLDNWTTLRQVKHNKKSHFQRFNKYRRTNTRRRIITY